MKKQIAIIIFLVTILFLVASAIPLTNATVMTVAQNGATVSTVNGASIQCNFPSAPASGQCGGAGQIFKPSTTGYLETITLSLALKSASPGGTIYMNVSNIASGTATTPGSLVEQSETTWACSQLSTTMTDYTFQFAGTSQLSSDNFYVFFVYIVGGDNFGGGARGLYIPGTANDVYMGNNEVYEFNGAWGGSSTVDFKFGVICDSTLPPTPTPTPTPTASPTGNPYQYWNGTAWVPYTLITPEPNIFDNGTATPYIQMLVPVIILAVAALLGWKFAGAWGFFAGLNVGAILCYVILGSSVFPLWGIIALLVVDGLLLFGKVGIRS